MSRVREVLNIVEGLYRETEARVRELLEMYSFIIVTIDSRSYLTKAARWCIEHGYGLRRVFDVAHMMAARDLGCRYIAAVNRFMKRHARESNLIYVNYYTGAP